MCLANSTNLVIILGMMQVSKRVPFSDPDVLNMCRGGYLLSNLIILGIYLYIGSVIDKKKGMNARILFCFWLYKLLLETPR